MKKTVTVNLNGRVFTMDEDAYLLLDKYLDNLRIHFRKEEDPKEIIADFEARIEELLSEKLQGRKQIITIGDVEEVIRLMGNPSDFSEIEEEDNNPKKEREPQVESKKRLFRNPDDKMLGGLCSGVAAFVGCDAWIVRVLALLLLIITYGSFAIVYIILWLLIPQARTAEEKLQMRGKPITVENIGKVVSSGTETIKQNKGCLNGLLNFFVVLMKICLVGLGILIGLPLAFSLIVVIVALFAALLGIGSGIALLPFADWGIWANEPLLATISLLFVILIPTIVIIYSIVAAIAKFKPLHAGIKWGIFIVWVIALVLFLTSGIRVEKDSWWYAFDDDWRNAELLEGNEIPADTLIALPLLRSVELDGRLNGDLQIEQRKGEESCLFISGDSNLLEEIETRISDNGKLDIRPRGNYRFKRENGIRLLLQTPDLKQVRAYGTNRVEFAGPFRSDLLKIKIAGSGSVEADSLYLKRLQTQCDGKGEMNLGGRVGYMQTETNGSSNIHAISLESDTVDIRIRGKANIDCDPRRYLEAEIIGNGQIRYKGNTINKKTRIIGSGSIKTYK
ncbi:DUF2807 domain-containing protein [Bacteroidales bacterium OttesenSCG-928-L03]|nr:DUF2807 domain-containing protein [Bacteroidales bacterium OttesenSCG-928-L03]